jgi:hypothetical protein
MDTPPAPVETTSSPGPLPSELEEKLRTCEAIAARMSMLQRQVDLELQQLHTAPVEVPQTSYYESPAILAAVAKLLRWIREKVFA